MKKCPSCKHSCANNAKTCPKCGHVFPTGGLSTRMKVIIIIGSIIALLLIISTCSSNGSNESSCIRNCMKIYCDSFDATARSAGESWRCTDSDVNARFRSDCEEKCQ